MRLSGWILVVVSALTPLWAAAQARYAPDPFFNGGGGWGGGWGGWYSPATAAESYQRGFADVVRSAGQANLMNSMAAQNLEQARSMDFDNRVKWTESYYQMRQANRAYRASKRSPRLSEEEIARIARAGLPKRLTSSELDPLTGQITWPVVLRDEQYTPERKELDKLFDQRAVTSSISPEVYEGIQKSTTELLAALKKNINQYKANDWLSAKKFVDSLAYEIRFPAG